MVSRAGGECIKPAALHSARWAVSPSASTASLKGIMLMEAEAQSADTRSWYEESAAQEGPAQRDSPADPESESDSDGDSVGGDEEALDGDPATSKARGKRNRRRRRRRPRRSRACPGESVDCPMSANLEPSRSPTSATKPDNARDARVAVTVTVPARPGQSVVTLGDLGLDGMAMKSSPVVASVAEPDTAPVTPAGAMAVEGSHGHNLPRPPVQASAPTCWVGMEPLTQTWVPVYTTEVYGTTPVHSQELGQQWSGDATWRQSEHGMSPAHAAWMSPGDREPLLPGPEMRAEASWHSCQAAQEQPEALQTWQRQGHTDEVRLGWHAGEIKECNDPLQYWLLASGLQTSGPELAEQLRASAPEAYED